MPPCCPQAHSESGPWALCQAHQQRKGASPSKGGEAAPSHSEERGLNETASAELTTLQTSCSHTQCTSLTLFLHGVRPSVSLALLPKHREGLAAGPHS